MDKIFEVTITPLDTVFFRDAKPFTMGDDSWGNGLFPPAPSVLYGAIRSAYLYQHPHILEEGLVDTDQDPSKSIEVIGVNLNYKTRDLFPLPLDLVQQLDRLKEEEKEDKKRGLQYAEVCLLNLGGEEEGDGSQQILSKGLGQIDVLTKKDTKVELLSLGLLAENVYDKYLKGRDVFNNAVRKAYTLDQLFVEEPKIGNQSARTLLTDNDRALYRVGFKRMKKDLSFNVKVRSLADLSVLNKSFIRLGGEGKLAKLAVKEIELKNKPIKLDTVFKLVLTSPTFFEKGWFSQELADVGFELITAVVGSPVAIGGFDLAKKCPKPLRKAVPAGSVYYYRASSEAQINSFFNGKFSLCKVEADRKQGYGLFKLAKK